jgi:hypothetical protein
MAHNSPINQKEGEFLKILNLLKRKRSATAREIRNYCWTLRTTPIPQIRQMMVQLSEAGYATLTGHNDQVCLTVEGVEDCRGTHLHPQTQSQRDIQPNCRGVEVLGGVDGKGNGLQPATESSPPAPPHSLQGGGILYTSTAEPQTQSQTAIEPVEADLYTTSTASTPDPEPDANYFDVM